ncbi:DUF418 domain-containing protein [Solicola gregarius]|uniref:DUF418 domain-containing protein n=1 Tax=Solicola gregarius TaxID=2908642 RepID=A0AA46TKV4_9ACTN|nr:DUF418 domain-containing protein [Solicola gregarius]UYM07135.1 DUF418 domain-containing protein [Solicola gregarius]
MSTTAAGPTALAERALGPDLARGVMLLFIALANSHYFLRGSSILGGYPQDASPLDSAVTWLLATFVVGMADGLLFFAGDILAMYGVLLLLGAWVVFWKDRWLLVLALLVFVMTALPSADYASAIADPPDSAMLPPDVGTMLSERTGAVGFVALLGPIGFACPFLIGLVAGRHRVLEQPERHRILLTVTAVVGLGVSVLGAQPIALVLSGARPLPGSETLELIGPLHDATGVLGGFGYAALITLIAHRIGARRGAVINALAATGQRSMTCYLVQSVVWAIVFTPFLLDLSATLTVASTALLATGTWLVTVVLADRMRRTGQRGPFEVLVRRVTYRQPRRATL